MSDDEERAALDNADPEDVRQALIDVLRQSDGEELRPVGGEILTPG